MSALPHKAQAEQTESDVEEGFQCPDGIGDNQALLHVHLKNMGQAGEQYTQTMIDTKYTAEAVKCQTNMRAIFQNIQMYALSNEGYPPSLQELIQWSGNTRLFQCPSPDGGKYVYISGQNSRMSPANILLYEPEPVHDGRCSVLRLGGQIELLTPEELQQALAQTQAAIR